MKHTLLLIFLLLFSYTYSQDTPSEYKASTPDIEFSIYPNPVQDSFSIKTDVAIIWIKIYNVFGKQVAQFSSQDSYDVSSLKKGLYLLRLETENSVAVHKLAIE